MLTRIAAMALVSAFPFTAPAIAGEAIKKTTFRFVQPKSLNPDGLTDGFWIDSTQGVDCDTYAKAYSDASDSSIPTSAELQKQLATYAIEVSGKGMSYDELPNGEETCTFTKQPLKISGNQSISLSTCSGDHGGKRYLGETIIKISPTVMVHITTSVDPLTGNPDSKTTASTVLTYCGKGKLPP